MSEQSRLADFPIAWFAVVMGLAGLTLAWSGAERALRLSVAVSPYLRALTAGVFVALAALYVAKLVAHRDAVARELEHPVKLNFFPTVSIALILLSMLWLRDAPLASRVLWTVGAAAHLAFTFYVMNAWINHTRFEIHHINPAWFIPVVGNILVPIAGVRHASPEISWFFFSIGLLFWLILATIIFYRVIFHDPMPARLVPTMFILIAPPAVGFISYLALTNALDVFARVLYYGALFLTLLLLSQAPRFFRIPFFLSWWAYSFPMAAITIATLLFYQRTHLAGFYWLSLALLVVLNLILAGLIARTLVAVYRREICLEDA